VSYSKTLKHSPDKTSLKAEVLSTKLEVMRIKERLNFPIHDEKEKEHLLRKLERLNRALKEHEMWELITE